MTLVSDLMQETRRNLLGMHSGQMNVLLNGIGTTDAALTCTYPITGVSGIARGAYMAIDDEIIYVWSTDPTSNKVTAMQRGMLGTTAATHSSGAVIDINPRFAQYAVRYALQEEIRSWGPQVYQVKSTTIQLASDVRGYDLQQLVTDNFYNIMSIRRSTPVFAGATNTEAWPTIKHWSVIRPAPVSDFPSGAGLVIPDSFETGVNYASPDGISLTFTGSPLPTLNVVYACPFNVTTFTDPTDVLATVGLDATMIDIPPIGAAWRLLSQRETQRTFTEGQGQPADLQMVPPLYIAKAAAALKAQRDSRLNDCQIWLMNRYGIENWGL